MKVRVEILVRLQVEPAALRAPAFADLADQLRGVLRDRWLDAQETVRADGLDGDPRFLPVAFNWSGPAGHTIPESERRQIETRLRGLIEGATATVRRSTRPSPLNRPSAGWPAIPIQLAAFPVPALPMGGAAPALPKSPPPPADPDAHLDGILDFWEAESENRDPGPDRALARRIYLLLLFLRVAVASIAEAERFTARCLKIAEDEAATWDALKKTGADEAFFEAEGVAFPGLWASRIYNELHSPADRQALLDEAERARKAALDLVSGIAEEIWDRGLPLTKTEAAQVKRSDIGSLALSFNKAKAARRERIARYTKALVTWERTLTHFHLVNGYEAMLKIHVDQIRDGTLVIDPDSYASLKSAQFFQFKLKVFENAASSPDDMQAALVALGLQKPGNFFRGGLGSGLKYEWPREGVNAFWVEIDTADRRIRAASYLDGVTRSLTWAYERDYLTDAGREAYQAIKDDLPKMIATAIAIIVAQQIPGVNVAVDVVLLVEFGVDMLHTLFDLKDAFEAAGKASSVVDMEHASVRMASTLVGTGVKLLVWAATWGIRKGAKRIKEYRESKEFLERHGNSAEAREAIAKAKGDVAKAERELAHKREQERLARERAEAERRKAEKLREQEEAARREAEQRKREEASKEEQRKEEARRKEEERQREAAERRREEEELKKPLKREPFQTKGPAGEDAAVVEVVARGKAVVPTGKVEVYARGKAKSFTDEMVAELKQLKHQRQNARKEFDKDPANQGRIDRLEKLQHNEERSLDMAKTLKESGFPDTPAGNDAIIRHLLEVGQKITADNHSRHPSELIGTKGSVKLLTSWKVLPDGRAYLSTIVLIPRRSP